MKYFITGTETNPVLLIHGYCSDYHVWTYFEQELAKTNQVIVVSIPGYLSDEAPVTHNLSQLAEEIEKILETENIQKVHVVGHSMGGYIALELLANYPKRVNALTLLNSHCYTDNEDKKVNRSKTIDFIRKHGTKLYIKEIYRSLFSEQFQKEHHHLIETLKDRAKRYSVETLVQSSRAMIERKNHEQTLKSAQVPIQFIMGAKDNLVPLNDFGQQASLPSISVLKVFPDMGHMGMFESAELTIREISSFNHYATKIKKE